MATCSNPRKIVPKTVTNSVQSSIHCKWSFCIFSLVHTKDPSLKFKSFPFPTMIMNDVKGETWCEGLEQHGLNKAEGLQSYGWIEGKIAAGCLVEKIYCGPSETPDICICQEVIPISMFLVANFLNCFNNTMFHCFRNLLI